MTENYASKSAPDREKSLLDDSHPAKGGTAWTTPFITIDRGRVEGRSLGRIRRWSFHGNGPGFSMMTHSSLSFRPLNAENSFWANGYFHPADSAALAPFHRARPMATDLLVKNAKQRQLTRRLFWPRQSPPAGPNDLTLRGFSRKGRERISIGREWILGGKYTWTPRRGVARGENRGKIVDKNT
jgi:hypothetical protein